jgi:phenylpropionate dioxygenase-like ring-hydroxylating dioxygenase large terminal subunit
MIPNQWYVILESKQVKARPVGVTRLGGKLVLWADRAGRLGCLRDQCTHRGVRLSQGKVIGDRPVIEYRRRREELIAAANAERVQR